MRARVKNSKKTPVSAQAASLVAMRAVHTWVATDQQMEVVVKVPQVDIVPGELHLVLVPKAVDQQPEEQGGARGDGHGGEAVKGGAKEAHKHPLARRDVQPIPLHVGPAGAGDPCQR